MKGEILYKDLFREIMPRVAENEITMAYTKITALLHFPPYH